MADGLWKGPSALTMDYVTLVRRLKLLGFNAVRLPFSMKVRRCSNGTPKTLNAIQMPPGHCGIRI